MRWQKVMAACPRVYDSPHLRADCQEPLSAPEPYARQSSTGCLLPLPFVWRNMSDSGWRSSLRSSARKRFSSLQRSAGRRILRLQKALSIGNTATNTGTNDIVSGQTANADESSR